MKRILLILVCVCFFIISCGTPKIINGTYHDTFGVVNRHQKENTEVLYRVIPGNAVWSVVGVVFFPIGLIAPVYFIGFDLWEPIGPKCIYGTK